MYETQLSLNYLERQTYQLHSKRMVSYSMHWIRYKQASYVTAPLKMLGSQNHFEILSNQK